ncbi:T9SS type A sorting domain-containing protein [Bacteroidota bacterium]
MFNTLGEEVAVLIDKEIRTGTYKVEWNASNVPSGVYCYQLQTEGHVETKKMILMK